MIKISIEKESTKKSKCKICKLPVIKSGHFIHIKETGISPNGPWKTTIANICGTCITDITIDIIKKNKLKE